MSELKADLVLKNGSVYTVDPDRAWAQAIAVSKGKIIYAGSDDGLEGLTGAETVVLDIRPGVTGQEAATLIDEVIGAGAVHLMFVGAYAR